MGGTTTAGTAGALAGGTGGTGQTSTWSGAGASGLAGQAGGSAATGGGATAGAAGSSAGAAGSSAGAAGSESCSPDGTPPIQVCFTPPQADIPCPWSYEPSLKTKLVDNPDFCGVACVVSGPTFPPEQSGCCYQAVIVCEGRPLVIGQRQRWAPLEARAGWG